MIKKFLIRWGALCYKNPTLFALLYFPNAFILAAGLLIDFHTLVSPAETMLLVNPKMGYILTAVGGTMMIPLLLTINFMTRKMNYLVAIEELKKLEEKNPDQPGLMTEMRAKLEVQKGANLKEANRLINLIYRLYDLEGEIAQVSKQSEYLRGRLEKLTANRDHIKNQLYPT